MSARTVGPPSGHPPPEAVQLGDGEEVQLGPVAEEICRRHRAEYPDEAARYGDAGIAWCVHDNKHVLRWALLEPGGYYDLDRQIAWLAKVLEARDYPLERLARDLVIAAEVVEERVEPPAAEGVADSLRRAAEMVAGTETFL